MKRVLDSLAMDADDKESDAEMADAPAHPLVTSSNDVEKEKRKDKKKKRKADVMDIDAEEEVSPKKKKDKDVEGSEDIDKAARKAAKKAAKAAKSAAADAAAAVPLPEVSDYIALTVGGNG
jgi:nucleolar protein 56